MTGGHSQQSWWRSAAALFLMTALFNYPWEMAQSPLYKGMPSLPERAWHCFLASFGDGVLVLLIWMTGWAVYGRSDWFSRPGTSGYGLMLLAGLLIGVVVEWGALSIGRWSYTAHMPRVGELGLVPLLQMVILPPLTFGVVTKALRPVVEGERTR